MGSILCDKGYTPSCGTVILERVLPQPSNLVSTPSAPILGRFDVYRLPFSNLPRLAGESSIPMTTPQCPSTVWIFQNFPALFDGWKITFFHIFPCFTRT